jgi:hypothetical protein
VGEVIAMPKLLYARPPTDAEDEQKIRKLAGSRHAPADWVMRAKMIAASWGRRPDQRRRRAVGLPRADRAGTPGAVQRRGPGRAG